MDIEGLGAQRIGLFVDLGLIGDIADIYEIDWDRLGDLRRTITGWAADALGLARERTGNPKATWDDVDAPDVSQTAPADPGALDPELMADLGVEPDRLKAMASTLGGLAEDGVANLQAAIEASKDRPLANLLVGLNVRHLGPSAAQALAVQMGSLEHLMEASVDDIAAIEGLGTVIAESVHGWLADAENRRLLERLIEAGVNVQGPERSDVPAVLEGKSVVVTGTLDGYTRDEVEAAIVERGGTSPGSVSKRTFAVVVGASPGASKLTKAESLGIPVLDQAGFEQLLASGELPS